MNAPSERPSGTTEYYDAYWSEQGFNPPQALIRPLRELLEANLGSDDRCLDVGCGAGGGPAGWLAERAGSYVGVDVSEAAVQRARGRGLNVELIEDASHLPFDDASFDLAVCIEVLEHLVDPAAAAGEILRVLRPGGRLVTTVPNVAFWRRRADLALLGRWNPLGDDQSAHRPWRDPHLRFFGRANLAAMLLEAGFEPVETGGHGGSWMADIPGLRKLMRRRDPGPIFGMLVRLAPSLFAHHLHAVAIRPAAEGVSPRQRP